jgi:para-nitrobenzyl esterase
MSRSQLTRRDAVAAALAAAFTAALPIDVAFSAAEATETMSSVGTQSGKVRGKRMGGVSAFLGIPYGSDTGTHRFQPARAPKAWTGVRDCFAFGPQAPQEPFLRSEPDLSSDVGRTLAAIFSAGTGSELQSEDCLVLNVYTPDASAQRRRPVMVWLHGGGFTSGSAGIPLYDGSALCRRGDVVVVSLNHRLNALGYLYLGALHEDFADSGNLGQLDIALALRWVRDNIAGFGGDPGNVTIFGESGGGAKVGVLLAMPPAKGLFHKGIIESGPVVKMVEKDDAAEVADRTLAALGIAKSDVHQLQHMDRMAIIKAASAVQLPGGKRTLGPVVDGRSLPSHPFYPKATEVSRDVPVIIGTNKDEATLFMGLQPDFGKITTEEAHRRFDVQVGERSAAAFEMYRKARPDDQPTYWIASMTTDMGTWMNSIRLAERKADQQAAPVFMYRLDWEAPAANGALRSPHGLEVPLVFDNVNIGSQSQMLGTGPEPKKLAAIMSQAWINFARTGDPSQKELPWPRYGAKSRETMIFDAKSHMVADPDREKREFWAASTPVIAK